MGSRAPSSLLHHATFAEHHRGVDARDRRRRRRRARAQGGGGGEELRMTATQQEELLDHEVKAQEGLAGRITAFETEGE